MNRPAIIVIGVVFIVAIQYVPMPDNVTTFGLGGLVGIVLGAVLGAAFVVGEKESPEHD